MKQWVISILKCYWWLFQCVVINDVMINTHADNNLSQFHMYNWLVTNDGVTIWSIWKEWVTLQLSSIKIRQLTLLTMSRSISHITTLPWPGYTGAHVQVMSMLLITGLHSGLWMWSYSLQITGLHTEADETCHNKYVRHVWHVTRDELIFNMPRLYKICYNISTALQSRYTIAVRLVIRNICFKTLLTIRNRGNGLEQTVFGNRI